MLLLSALALADIPPSRPVSHTLQIEGLAEHPGFVLVLAGEERQLWFSATSSSAVALSDELLRGKVWLLPRGVGWAEPHPPGAVDCGLELRLRPYGRRGGEEVHVYRLTEASAETCVLTEGSAPPAEALPDPEIPPAPAVPPPAQEESSAGGCATAAAGPGAVLLAMLLGLRRRKSA